MRTWKGKCALSQIIETAPLMMSLKSGCIGTLLNKAIARSCPTACNCIRPILKSSSTCILGAVTKRCHCELQSDRPGTTSPPGNEFGFERGSELCYARIICVQGSPRVRRGTLVCSYFIDRRRRATAEGDVELN